MTQVRALDGTLKTTCSLLCRRPLHSYTIHVSLRRQPSLANSLALCPAGSTPKTCNSATALIVVRIYTAGTEVIAIYRVIPTRDSSLKLIHMHSQT